MSELTAVIIGLGIGSLISLPALLVYRRDIASNFRRLLKGESRKGEEHGQTVRPGDGPSTRFHEVTEGLSPAVATFGIGAGAITALYGVFIGGVVFLVSGVFLVLGVLVALVATRAVKG